MTGKIFKVFGLVIVVSMLFAACAPAATPAPTTAPEPTAAEATAAPTADEAAAEPTAAETDAAEPTATGEAEAPAKPDKIYKVVFWEHGPWTREPVPSLEEDWIASYIRDNYGLEISLQAAPADGGDAKLNAMIAAGEIPDFIQSYFTVASLPVKQMVDQQILIPIDEQVAAQPRLSTFLDEKRWTYLSLDGKKYGLAQPLIDEYDNFYTTWIRSDWLEAVGMDAPTNMEELAAVAKAFTEQDPDKNGQNDTYGFTSCIAGNAPFCQLMSVFAPFGAYPGHNNILIADNQVVFDAFSPQMKDALTWWRQQVEAGVVDPNWTTAKYENWRDVVSQGKIGILSGQFQMLRTNCTSLDCLGDQFAASIPDAKWEMLPALNGPYGEYVNWDRLPIDNTFWFTIQADSEPGKLDAIMKFFNDALDPETDLYIMMNYGKPGVTYVEENGKPVERLIVEGMNWRTYWAVFRVGDLTYWNVVWSRSWPEGIKNLEFTAGLPTIPHVTALVRPHESWADLNAFIQEMHVKFAVGEEPLENWDAFVEEAMTTYNGEAVIQDATEQLKSLGLIK